LEQLICKNCDYIKNAPEGICSRRKASDGLDIRCVGLWSKDKYFYIKRYLEIFTKAMKDKWKGNLYYIDLFAGCGKCRIRETGEEIDGSALISLQLKFPFKRYFFVDLNPRALNALEKRIKDLPLVDKVSIRQGDCNEKVGEIITEIPQTGALCLALIDPTGLQIKFETIERLVKNRKVDLVVTFPEGMAIKRNIEKFLRQQESPLDEFMGDRNWRIIYECEKLNTLNNHERKKRLITLYKENLKKLGYVSIKSEDEILIKSSQKRLPLYYILFASKHSLGHKFWSAVSEIEPTGQQKFKFDASLSSYLLQNKAISKPRIHRKDYRLLDDKKRKLVERVNDGSIVKRFDKTPYPVKPTNVVCPHFLELKWAYGCPFDCSWCYLKGTFRFRPEGIKPAYKPLEKVKLHIETFLQEEKTPEILNTGEIADSLMGENGDRPFSKFIISLFEKQNRHKVLFVTKSTNVKNLLEIALPRQVVVSFSLNAKPVAKRWEKKAPSVERRIEAAKKLSEADYEVRIRIDPMVPVENWEKCYIELIDEIFSRFIPERITFGSLRGLQSTINGTKDTSWVKYLKESSNWGKKIDFTTRYKIYAIIIEYLGNKYDYHNVALCKETKAMWEKLGMDWKQIRCNCVW